MKKLFALILALVMVLSLAACGGDKDNTVADGNTEPTGNTTGTVNNSTESTQGTTDSTTPSATEPPTTTAPATTPPAITPPATTPPATTPPATQPDHAHSYALTVTAATCTAQGYTTYTCSCGHSYTADYTNPKNHSYSKKVTAATCTAQGYTTYACSCGHSYVSDYVNPSHSYSNYACSKCGTVDKSHAYEYLMEWVKTNGTRDGENIEYVFEGKNNAAHCLGLTYSAKNNYLYVWYYDATSGYSSLTSIFLNDYYYGFSFGDDRIYGYIKPSTYAKNTSLTYTSSYCSVLAPEKLLPVA
jgi:hypothetical protein